MTNQGIVELWMENMDRTVSRHPTLYVTLQERFDRCRLITEEPFELHTAIHENISLEKIADGIGDSLVVIYGAAALYGLNADECFRECMRSNFSKDKLNQHSKGGKGKNFVPPDFSKIILPWR